MSTIAIILLATFTASDFARVRLDKAEDAMDARAFEHGATTAADDSQAASAGVAAASLQSPGAFEKTLSHFRMTPLMTEHVQDNEPVARAVAALEAAVDESDAWRSLGDSAIEASIAKLDAIKVVLADSLSDSLAKREQLYDAAGRGEVDVVRDLVKHGVSINSNIGPWHVPGSTGTALQHAAKEGHPEVVRVLLEAGAEKDSCDRDGKSPLWFAADGTFGDSIGVMRVLLEANANTALPPFMNGRLPLQTAASKGREEAVRLLIDYGADVDGSGASSDQQGGKNQGSPLVSATGENANPKVARILINAGANTDLAGRISRTPLHNCAKWGHAAHAEIARLLLEADANKDAIDDYGNTPLLLAASAGSTEVARILIEAGSNSRHRNTDFMTPIKMAKNEEIRKMLEMVQTAEENGNEGMQEE